MRANGRYKFQGIFNSSVFGELVAHSKSKMIFYERTVVNFAYGR